MLNIISDIVFKNRYGVIQEIVITFNEREELYHYTIKTMIGERYAGVLTKKQIKLLESWVLFDKLHRWHGSSFTPPGQKTVHTKIALCKTVNKWGWFDIFRFRNFTHPSGAVATDIDALY